MEDLTTLEEYLHKHNPLALKDVKNKVLFFKDYNDAYLHVLKEIRIYCKRGYIELALLVKHLTQFDDGSCEDLQALMIKNNATLAETPLLMNWLDVGHEKERLQTIVEAMHEPSGASFDWVAFEYAWLVFRQWNEEQNQKDNEEDIT